MTARIWMPTGHLEVLAIPLGLTLGIRQGFSRLYDEGEDEGRF